MADSMSRVRQRTVPSSDGAPALAYVEAGAPAAPVVLLLHSLGADSRMWRPQWDDLAASYRVLAMDSRGHGRSGWDGSVSVEAWSDDVERVLAHADVRRVCLVGVSMGGIQAMTYAARHPERVAGLVIADSFARVDADVAEGKIATLAGQAERLGMGALADAYVEDTFTSTPAPPSAHDIRDAIAGLDPAAYTATVRTCFTADVAGLLPRITAPALVVWGERDAKTPLALSEAIAAGLPDARLHRIPEAGHLSNLENPAAFTALVADFLGTRARFLGTRARHEQMGMARHGQ
jgi:3-oxoadipate enol-lactonase